MGRSILGLSVKSYYEWSTNGTLCSSPTALFHFLIKLVLRAIFVAGTGGGEGRICGGHLGFVSPFD
jgi:hypothetical protein